MPASWPAAALQAQAVAARSYALRSVKPGTPFDVLPNQSSQVYGGVEAESPATTAAVRRTEPLVAMAGATVAATYFSSSSGGRTAAVEEGFPGADPVSYLVSVDDPHDTLSPDHDWTVTLTAKQARKRLGDAVLGKLERVVVAARTPTGRAAAVAVVGSEGTKVVDAGTVRARLELKSVWFKVTRQPAARTSELIASTRR
jgi:stage II sporulation protein D